jgi:uncharacterized membrane protein HdeD (DUF308 family)
MNDAIVRTNWLAFFLFGMMLCILGAIAIVVPQIPTVAAESIVGFAFMVGGLAQIAQAVRAWRGLCGICGRG